MKLSQQDYLFMAVGYGLLTAGLIVGRVLLEVWERWKRRK